MKIAYATKGSVDNAREWSGTVFFIHEALKAAGCEVLAVDYLREKGRRIGKFKIWFYQRFFGLKFLRHYQPWVVSGYARQIEKLVSGKQVDVVFTPRCIFAARLKPGVPVVFWADACFAQMVDFYPFATGLCEETLKDANRIEQEALDRCSLALFASEWAAEGAMKHYKVDRAKVKVVPFGANLTQEVRRENVIAAVDARSSNCCELLFLGVKWDRKGGDIALEAAIDLNRRGIPSRLHVVGCEPPGEMPDFVVRHGFISKDLPEGRAKLDSLLANAHFLIVPSRAECYGLVFAEASSCGVPSLSTEVGGIPTVVRDGVNGRLFPLEARGDVYADAVASLWADRVAYREMALRSLQEYTDRLNWQVAGAEVLRLLQDLKVEQLRPMD